MCERSSDFARGIHSLALQCLVSRTEKVNSCCSSGPASVSMASRYRHGTRGNIVCVESCTSDCAAGACGQPRVWSFVKLARWLAISSASSSAVAVHCRPAQTLCSRCSTAGNKRSVGSCAQVVTTYCSAFSEAFLCSKFAALVLLHCDISPISRAATMSWQSYIDQMVSGGQVTKAGIFGHDGSPWAASPGFTVKQPEVQAMVKGIADPSPLYGSGVHIGGTRYVFLRPSVDGKALYCKKSGQGGACVYKSSQAVIVGLYDEGMQAGGCNVSVEKIGEYLVGAGY